AVYIEGIFMAPAVLKALRFRPSIETEKSIALAATIPLKTVQASGAALSTNGKQRELQPSLSAATSDNDEMAKTPMRRIPIIDDDELEETELLPKVSLFTIYTMTRTQPLPTIPAELEMQKLLSISVAITDKHKRIQLHSSSEHLAANADQTAKRQRLPKTSASIADDPTETQRLPKISVPIVDDPEETQQVPKISVPIVDDPEETQQVPKISVSTADEQKETQQAPKIAASTVDDAEETQEQPEVPAPVADEPTETQQLPKIPVAVLQSAQEISTILDASSGLFCPQCNAALPANAKFCGACGKDIEVELTREHKGEEQPEILEESLEVYKQRSVASIISVIVTVALPFCALILWFTSLSTVAMHMREMTNLGLVSILPPTTIIAPFLVTVSFFLSVWQKKEKTPVILLHFLILLFMLYGITALIEAVPRFAIVYRHAGYTEYIMRRGGVDPTLDAYFDWPGFFIFAAFMTKIAGYSSILPYAAWSPFFLNVIYFFPLYVIFTSATADKRIVWFGIWFFYLTNWIAQDYLSPQGLNFFLYLVIIAILVKWFKVPPQDQFRRSERWWQRLIHRIPLVRRVYDWLTAPDTYITSSSPRQRALLLISLIAIFGFMVFSHPLTPFFTIPGVTALIIFRRCKPFWLPILMIVMTAAWVLIMAQPYLVSNLNNVVGDFGHINRVVTQNVTDRATQGDSAHNFISDIRLLMTAL
ncbi:MAG: hypothetical protein JO011_02910, partial [Ktedonobacteraceae bacterium]|nr:hypothetical protein [Ktedonobacteraceae bacterium]